MARSHHSLEKEELVLGVSKGGRAATECSNEYNGLYVLCHCKILALRIQEECDNTFSLLGVLGVLIYKKEAIR